MRLKRLGSISSVVIVLIILLLTLSYANFKYSKNNIEKAVQSQNNNVLDEATIHLQNFLDERMKRMTILSNILKENKEGIGYFIENEYREDKKYYSIAYLNINGDYIYRAPYNEKYAGTNVLNIYNDDTIYKFTQIVKQTKKPAVTDIFKIDENKLGLSIMVPVIENGEVKGFFGSTYDTEQIGKDIIYSKVKDRDTIIFGISKNGLITFCQDKQKIGKSIYDNDTFQCSKNSLDNYLKMSKGEIINHEQKCLTNIKGKQVEEKRYMVSKPVKFNDDFKFSLAVTTPSANIKMMYEFIVFQLLITLIIFLLAIVIGTFYARNYREKKELEKSLAQTEAYDKLKTDFFCNMSHELRTPLTIMLNGLHFILMKYQEEVERDVEFKKIFLKIRQNAFRLLKLVNNFLEISRLDAGVEFRNFRNVDIVKIIEDISMSVVFYAKQKGIDLIFDTQVEEKVIAVDEDGIEKVIMNLLSNAIKFTSSEGEIYVNIDENPEYVVISVKDNGIGIPEDKVNFIFQRFTQVDSSLRRIAEGTGIGLAIVKSIVEMHNGKIEVKSKEGEGSEFIIYIPNKTVEGETVASKKIDQEIVNAINIEFSDI